MAQKPHIPDDVSRAKVEALVVAGVTQEHIAKVIGIDAKTLRKYYHDEIEIALQKVIGNISNTLVQKAISGDTASIIFFLKARAGWSEKQVHELTGKDGGPLAVEVVSARDILAGRIAGLASRSAAVGDTGKPE